MNKTKILKMTTLIYAITTGLTLHCCEEMQLYRSISQKTSPDKALNAIIDMLYKNTTEQITTENTLIAVLIEICTWRGITKESQFKISEILNILNLRKLNISTPNKE
ncbi:MAG: hypothetical protein UR26_C0003G0121 [candidate division TM6 bacterium GW2011_GWF2_32_72]|nr:MAG: hypothetical protein UR26_C0003G0121 [candidate division TM6 bacterium GW2011_GWF2_32_72]